MSVLHFSLESMIVEYKQQAYDADLKESELKIVEEELQKMELRRIQELGITCETTKEERKMTIASIYIYIYVYDG